MSVCLSTHSLVGVISMKSLKLTFLLFVLHSFFKSIADDDDRGKEGKLTFNGEKRHVKITGRVLGANASSVHAPFSSKTLVVVYSFTTLVCRIILYE